VHYENLMKQEFEKVAKIWCCSRVTFWRASMFVALAKNVPSLSRLH